MEHKIKNILNSFVNLSPFELSIFEEILQPVHYKKSAYFLKQGQLSTQIAFVEEGLLELYKTDENGNEISLDFIFPNDFATDYVSILSNSAAEISIRTIKPSKLLVFDKRDMDDIFDQSIQLQKLGRIIAERFFIDFANRIRESFLPPEERYYKLMKSKPHWIKLLPQYKIASYLNISPEWLSKIKSKK